MKTSTIRFIFVDNVADFLIDIKGWADDKNLDDYIKKLFNDDRFKVIEEGDLLFYKTDMINDMNKDYPEIADMFAKLAYKDMQLFLEYHFDGHEDFEIGEIEVEHHEVGDILKSKLNKTLEEKLWNSQNIREEIDTMEKEIVAGIVKERVIDSITELKQYCINNSISINFDMLKN